MVENISFKKVSISDARFLYNLLAERQPRAFITHKKIPTWSEHINFVKSNPYSKWYIIRFRGKKVGSISLTLQNEIGIWIKKDIQHKGIGTAALKLLIKKEPNLRYLANINPRNHESMKFFKKNNFKIIQYTYELIMNK